MRLYQAGKRPARTERDRADARFHNNAGTFEYILKLRWNGEIVNFEKRNFIKKFRKSAHLRRVLYLECGAYFRSSKKLNLIQLKR